MKHFFHTLLFVLLCINFCIVSNTHSQDIPPNTDFHTTYEIRPAEGLGFEEGVVRRDPSDVIRVDDTYYVWYTKSLQQMPGAGYNATVWYATSQDGTHWKERGECVARGGRNTWDEASVFTPNILVAEGKYYLYYTAVSKYSSREELEQLPTAIGMAVADSPDGPWTKFSGNPVLKVSDYSEIFDSFRVDDACLIIRDGRYWLYYKGRQVDHTPRETKMGVAIADNPTGPYIKYAKKPLIFSGHEVLVWPYKAGVVSLVTNAGKERNTMQFAPDGIEFTIMSKVENTPKAPGAYRPDAFTNTRNAAKIHWGISMIHHKQWPYLVRFDCTSDSR